MYGLIFLMTAAIAATVAAGVYLEMCKLRPSHAGRWRQRALLSNLTLFVGAQGAMLFLGAQEVMAAVPDGGTADISVGTGLAIIGIGIPTAFSTVAAGIAVGPIGSASLAALAEKPEMFGRTLIYLGLAEGIAIYGLVMSILLLDKI